MMIQTLRPLFLATMAASLLALPAWAEKTKPAKAAAEAAAPAPAPVEAAPAPGQLTRDQVRVCETTKDKMKATRDALETERKAIDDELAQIEADTPALVEEGNKIRKLIEEGKAKKSDVKRMADEFNAKKIEHDKRSEAYEQRAGTFKVNVDQANADRTKYQADCLIGKSMNPKDLAAVRAELDAAAKK